MGFLTWFFVTCIIFDKKWLTIIENHQGQARKQEFNKKCHRTWAATIFVKIKCWRHLQCRRAVEWRRLRAQLRNTAWNFAQAFLCYCHSRHWHRQHNDEYNKRRWMHRNREKEVVEEDETRRKWSRRIKVVELSQVHPNPDPHI